MASLTIRNISVTPLELTLVERFEADPATSAQSSSGGAAVGKFFWGLARAPFRLIGGAGACGGDGIDSYGGLVPKPGAAPIVRDEIRDVAVKPFETRPTDIRAADPTREVLRLTLVADHAGRSRTYTVDVPAASARSIELQPVDAVVEGSGDDTPAFTAVYVPAGAHLAVMSSAALSSWMGTVDGAWPLSSLSLPGTHNSPACHYALPSVRCQAVDVRTQLANGVRFLDVRVNVHPHKQPHADPRLALVHSAFSVSLLGTRLFSELHDNLCAFLDEHPTETVLLSIKREGTGRGTDGDLAHQLLEHYVGHPDFAAKDNDDTKTRPNSRRWFTEPRIPFLEEACGRIVLIRRFRLPDNDDTFRQLHGGAGWGLDASVWPDNCADGLSGTGQLRLQDFYDVMQTVNIETKLNYVRALLEQSASVAFSKLMSPFHVNAAGAPAQLQPPPPVPPLFVNFLSGSNFFNASCWPENIAARVNPAVIEYLCIRHSEHGKGPASLAVGDGSTGIVVTDWVGHRGDWDLIRCIVAWNARLQLKQ